MKMLINFDEEKWSDAIIKDCITLENIDEQDIINSAYEMLDVWTVEDEGLLSILVEMAIEKFKEMNIEVQQ